MDNKKSAKKRAASPKKKNKRTSGQMQKPAQKKKTKKRKRPTKKQLAQMKKQRQQQRLKEYLLTAVISIAVVSVLLFFSIRLPKIEGYSMTPTINEKDRVVVNKWGKVKRFSLIAYKEPGEKTTTIRRVIGLPGETIAYKDGQLLVNQEPVVERFLSTELVDEEGVPYTADFDFAQDFALERIPEGNYFVLGDNRFYATEGRSSGLIDKKVVIGTVEMRIFPLHAMTHF